MTADEPAPSLPEVMPLAAAAFTVGLSEKTLHRAANAGELRVSQLCRRGGWVVQRTDLLAWLDVRANRERAAPPQPAADVRASDRRTRRQRVTGDGRVSIACD